MKQIFFDLSKNAAQETANGKVNLQAWFTKLKGSLELARVRDSLEKQGRREALSYVEERINLLLGQPPHDLNQNEARLLYIIASHFLKNSNPEKGRLRPIKGVDIDHMSAWAGIFHRNWEGEGLKGMEFMANKKALDAFLHVAAPNLPETALSCYMRDSQLQVELTGSREGFFLEDKKAYFTLSTALRIAGASHISINRHGIEFCLSLANGKAPRL